MILGMMAVFVGYALFYWGYHHLPSQKQRYSMWTLLGLDQFSQVLAVQAGHATDNAVQFKS